MRDRDDSAGPLDIASASVRVREAGRARNDRFAFTVRTFERWRSHLLAEGIDPNYVSVDLGRRCIEVEAGADGRLHARLRRPCVRLPGAIREASIRVRRPDRRRVRVVVTRKRLGGGRRWRATTSFQRAGDLACPAPDFPPPEQSQGACTDHTRRARLPG